MTKTMGIEMKTLNELNRKKTTGKKNNGNEKNAHSKKRLDRRKGRYGYVLVA